MKKACLILIIFILMLGSASAREVSLSRQAQNLTAFGKLCGYVKHFYPSDEAQEIPWAKFQAYGAQKVIKARDNEALRRILLELFAPVVTTLKLYSDPRDQAFDTAQLIPDSPSDYSVTFWQYRGLELSPENVYRSIRARRPFPIPIAKEQPYSSAILNLVLPKPEKPFTKARIYFSLQKPEADTLKIQYGIYCETQEVTDSLDVSGWQHRVHVFEGLSGDDLDLTLYFSDFETVRLDSLSCEIWVEEAWQSVYYDDFSASKPGTAPKNLNTNCLMSSKYVSANTDQLVEELEGNRVLAIRKAAPEASQTRGYINTIFEEESIIGDLVDEPLIKGLYCRFPLALYTSYEHSYPPSDSSLLSTLQKELEPIDLADPESVFNRLSGLISYWNHMSFFYPYWQYTKVDWEWELYNTIKKTLSHKDFAEYKACLRELISKTLDGHASLSARDEHGMIPGFRVDRVEGRWIVSGVADKALQIPLGSEVKTIDGKSFAKFMQRQRKFFTKATEQGTDSYLFTFAMMAYPDSVAVFSFRAPDQRKLEQHAKFGNYYGALLYGCPEPTASYSDDIQYVNIGLIDPDELIQMMPELARSKGIIFDLRDYPNVWIDFIAHLLNEPDNLETMYTKQYLYPGRELPRSDHNKPSGWYQEPAEPHLGGNIVFLCGANSISRTESFLQNFKYNKFGTIIGQPTSGVTGNVQGTAMAGGITIWWTGMFIENPDGSRFHGVGVIPDIIVQPSIKAFAEGRDAELERALLFLKDELKLEELPRRLE